MVDGAAWIGPVKHYIEIITAMTIGHHLGTVFQHLMDWLRILAKFPVVCAFRVCYIMFHLQLYSENIIIIRN